MARSPPAKDRPSNFTGTVRIDPLFPAPDPARALGVSVTFEPGARTAWHTHPLGQTLIVTTGCGLIQSWGGPIQRIRPGDVVWCPPGEKHWHGATATTAMTHIAIVEQLNGKTVDWMEKVSDEEYQADLLWLPEEDQSCDHKPVRPASAALLCTEQRNSHGFHRTGRKSSCNPCSPWLDSERTDY